MNRDIDYVLNYMTKYVKDKYMHDSEPMLNHKDIEIVLKYIYEKQQELERYKNIIENIEKLVRNQLYGAFVPTGRTDGKVLQEIERKIEELKGE